MSAEGKCVIFSAPSGAGKTTIVHHLLGHDLGLQFSISATSREQRNNEVDGKDYHFMTAKEFIKHIEADDFIEWEEVYPGQFYGTLRREVERIWNGGEHAIFDLDVIGGLDLKEIFEDRALAIFVKPPSLDELAVRLRDRGTESEEKVQERLSKAKHEIRFADRFDVILENNDLEEACNEAHSIVKKFLEG